MPKLTIQTQRQEFKYFQEDLAGIALDMVLIPAGRFVMGSPKTEADSREKERPEHNVNISLFFMGRYPITQAQWRSLALLEPIQKDLDPEPSYFQGQKRPVEQVSWQDALEFCARLSKYTGRNYRLPSEAEWEYACRAGTKTPFHFGETISTELANYDGNYVYGRGTKGKHRAETTDVDKFEVANAFGLSDMHGNVWEWCLDPWHDNYKGAPRDGKVWDGNNQKDYENSLERLPLLLADERSHVIRGGSWLNAPRGCRSAFRYYYEDVNYLDVGFRVVCDPH